MFDRYIRYGMRGFLVFLCLLAWLPGQLLALEKPETELAKVGVNPAIGQQLNLDLEFTDSSGKHGKLRDFLSPNLPTLVVPVYYHCPRLCGLLLSGVDALVLEMQLKLGTEYRLLTFSFDPEETIAQAEQRRSQHHAAVGAKDPSDWPFLVGTAPNVAALTKSIGFSAERDQGEFAHTTALILLTPEGKISQYFTGVTFSAWDVRLALIEASLGGLGTALDHVLLFCFRFDPTQGKYTWTVFASLRILGAVCIVLLFGLIGRMIWRERNPSTT